MEALTRSKVRLVARSRPAGPPRVRPVASSRPCQPRPALTATPPALPSPRRATPALPLPSHPNLKKPGAARSAQPSAYATMGVI